MVQNTFLEEKLDRLFSDKATDEERRDFLQKEVYHPNLPRLGQGRRHLYRYCNILDERNYYNIRTGEKAETFNR